MPLLDIAGGLLMDKPDVPGFTPINVQDEQSKALKGNLKAFPDISALGTKIAEFATSQLKSSSESLFPGTGAITAQTGQRIQEMLAGQLPKDVQDLIAQRAAARGISTGTAGSQLAQFGELRDIGQTSLAQIQAGVNSAQQWLQIAAQATPRVDVGQFMITPQFQVQTAIAERNAKFQRDWVSNQISSAFSTGSIVGQGLINFDAQVNEWLQSALGSKAGTAAAKPTP